jgi:uncharacterized phage-associated protein
MANICSAMAVANYIIRRFKKAKKSISKTKLQAILAQAHIAFMFENGRPLIYERICLMHFGFIFKSIAEIFLSLKSDEDIGPRNYTRLEKELKINLRSVTLESELLQADFILSTKNFLDKIISSFEDLSDAEANRKLISQNSPWRFIANKLGGNHLIQDYTEISHKFIYSLKGKSKLS